MRFFQVRGVLWWRDDDYDGGGGGSNDASPPDHDAHYAPDIAMETMKLTKEASRKMKLTTYAKAESNSRHLNITSDARLELSKMKKRSLRANHNINNNILPISVQEDHNP